MNYKAKVSKKLEKKQISTKKLNIILIRFEYNSVNQSFTVLLSYLILEKIL